MIEKRTQLSLLFDFYSVLLTEKQRTSFELYYHNDLSLGEIAEECQVSRQAVYDNIKRVEVILVDYEKKLKMADKYQGTKEKIQQALNLVVGLEKDYSSNDLEELKLLLETMMQEN